MNLSRYIKLAVKGNPKLKAPAARIAVYDSIIGGVRRICIDLPAQYPGLSVTEQARVDEALESMKRAFIDAKTRLENS